MIKIVVQTNDGLELGTFEAQKGKLITEMASVNDVEIPFSCGAGACGLCMCEVIEGRELINDSFLSHPLMELEKDQILTCISSIKDEYFDDGKDHIVVLKRYI